MRLETNPEAKTITMRGPIGDFDGGMFGSKLASTAALVAAQGLFVLKLQMPGKPSLRTEAGEVRDATLQMRSAGRPSRRTGAGGLGYWRIHLSEVGRPSRRTGADGKVELAETEVAMFLAVPVARDAGCPDFLDSGAKPQVA